MKKNKNIKYLILVVSAFFLIFNTAAVFAQTGQSCTIGDISTCPQKGYFCGPTSLCMPLSSGDPSIKDCCFHAGAITPCQKKSDPTDVCPSGMTEVRCSDYAECPASTPPAAPSKIKWAPIAPQLQINIPTLQPFTTQGMTQPDKEGNIYIPFVGQYIAGIYTWAVGIAGLIAVVLIITGGFVYLTSGGNAQRTQDAKDRISSALFGLLLLLASYVLLYTINPDLVKFKSLRIKVIERKEWEGRPGGGFAAGNPLMAQYDAMPCPASNEKNLKLFTTGYYKPSYGDKGPYASFECNVAMQCLCPGDKYENGKLKLEGREEEASCTYKSMSWRPCKKIEQNTPYCTRTTNGSEPAAGRTIAASKCFKMGCDITINQTPYTVEDTGSAIKGRHIDVFMGNDLDGARNMTGEKDAVLNDNCFE